MANQTTTEALFERYLDKQALTEEELAQLMADPMYGALLNEATAWQTRADNYQETSVPEWDASATFDSAAIVPPSGKSGRVNWALAASFALSFSMLMLALFDAKFSLNEQGFELAFGGQSSLSKNELTALLKQHQTDSDQAYLNLLQQVVSNNREERQKELSTLVKQINDQRQQDRALVRLQLNQLAEQIEQEPTEEYANIVKN